MKKKEADEMKGKNLGAIGITKFKSRSFEAFQKSGGKNLFPVDPSTPLEERPYMQRPGGAQSFLWELYTHTPFDALHNFLFSLLQLNRYA